MSKVTVIINEQHTLLPDQERVLSEKFSQGWNFLLVPADGWTLEEMRRESDLIWKSATDEDVVVFASPIPAMLVLMAAQSGFSFGINAEVRVHILVLHNDRRVAKELPGGKVVHTVAPDVWELF
jgi:hypothetical protein